MVLKRSRCCARRGVDVRAIKRDWPGQPTIDMAS
jgi:hypothetical protein